MDTEQQIVKLRDLAPVRVLSPLCLRMQSSDCRLNRVFAWASQAQRFLQERHPFADLRAVPPAAVLFFEQDDLPVGFIC